MAHSVITPQEMYEAERAVFAAGRASFDLMQAAGRGVADLLQTQYPTGSIRVLCGPGGNGGDGFIAASRLAEIGREVSVFLLGSVTALKGDPKMAAAQWAGAVGPLAQALEASADITLDALFGGGLSRPLAGIPAQLAEACSGTVVSVDVPSGLDGSSGQPLGSCFKASLTVTFAAFRPAHVVSPGKYLCGCVEVLDIGVPVPAHTLYSDFALSQIVGAQVFETVADAQGLTPPSSSFDRNPIEQLRALARQTGRAVLVRTPDRILAQPNGIVSIAPTAKAIKARR